MITLRDDQGQGVQDLRGAMRSHRRVLFRAPCGYGKTIVSTYIANSSVQKNKKVIFGVHRRELANQTARTFKRFGLPVSFIMDGMGYNPDSPIHIASADTLRTRHELIDCNLFIPDEAHLWGDGTRRDIIETAYQRGSYILNLTATPARGDGKPLSSIADVIVYTTTERELIERGDLARYKLIAPVQPNLSLLEKNGADYSKKSINELFKSPAVVSDAVKYYLKYAFPRRMIGYAHSRKRGAELAAEFTASGIPSLFIDGETPQDERAEAIRKFADREILVLFNCALFREGFDLSAAVGRDVPIEAVGLYVPTSSLPLAIQMMMRGMRPQEDVSIILDHASVCLNADGTDNHGLPDDDRSWSLTSDVKTKKSDAEAIIPTVICGQCFSIYRPSSRASCPYCGHDRDRNGRQIREIQQEMIEIDLEKRRLEREAIDQESIRKQKRRREGMAKTIDELISIAVDEGHNPFWVVHKAKHKKIKTSREEVLKKYRIAKNKKSE